MKPRSRCCFSNGERGILGSAGPAVVTVENQDLRGTRVLETSAGGSYLDYDGKDHSDGRTEGEAEEKCGKGTPGLRENGETVTPSPNRRGFDPGSLYDRNRWDPINLPLRGSRAPLSLRTYDSACTSATAARG